MSSRAVYASDYSGDEEEERGAKKIRTCSACCSSRNIPKQTENVIDLTDDYGDGASCGGAPARGGARHNDDISEKFQAGDAEARGLLDPVKFKEKIKRWKEGGMRGVAESFQKLLSSGKQWEDDIIGLWIMRIREFHNHPNRRCLFAHTGLFRILEGEIRDFPKNTGIHFNGVKLFAPTEKESFLFVPVCVEQFHWVLCVVDLKERNMVIYDSLKSLNWKCKNGDGENVVAREYISGRIRLWLQYRYINEMPDANIPTFPLEPPTQAIPRQGEATLDCGAFICMFMSYLSSGIKFDFQQKDMELIKRWMFRCLEDSTDYPMPLGGVVMG